MSYSDKYTLKLKDPRWQKKRLEVLNRAKFKCQCCGDDENTLHVHHLIYSKGDPWDAPDNTLECLCENCHNWREEFNSEHGRSRVPTKECYFVIRYLTVVYPGDFQNIPDASFSAMFPKYWNSFVKNGNTKDVWKIE